MLILNIVRHMVVGVCSFANTAGGCTSSPGGFSRLTLSVLQWIQQVKVKPVESRNILMSCVTSSIARLTRGSMKWK